MKHYYQTTPVESIEGAEKQAISQEDKIYRYMEFMGLSFTAWRLNEVFHEMCLTSIRRSLFNLEKQSKIFQQGFVPGPKGKPCGSYKVNNGKLF